MQNTCTFTLNHNHDKTTWFVNKKPTFRATKCPVKSASLDKLRTHIALKDSANSL